MDDNQDRSNIRCDSISFLDAMLSKIHLYS